MLRHNNSRNALTLGITGFIRANVFNEGKEGRGAKAGRVYAGRKEPWPEDRGRGP